MSTAEQMLLSEHVSSPHIERELKVLQKRWAAFHNQVVESRRLIDLSIEYFKLVEEVSPTLYNVLSAGVCVGGRWSTV